MRTYTRDITKANWGLATTNQPSIYSVEVLYFDDKSSFGEASEIVLLFLGVYKAAEQYF